MGAGVEGCFVDLDLVGVVADLDDPVPEEPRVAPRAVLALEDLVLALALPASLRRLEAAEPWPARDLAGGRFVVTTVLSTLTPGPIQPEDQVIYLPPWLPTPCPISYRDDDRDDHGASLGAIAYEFAQCLTGRSAQRLVVHGPVAQS